MLANLIRPRAGICGPERDADMSSKIVHQTAISEASPVSEEGIGEVRTCQRGDAMECITSGNCLEIFQGDIYRTHRFLTDQEKLAFRT
ncbi:hypothetical protein FP2506_02580 [Fulvimarina pelagi HTCC2506]|uniref:Uncharacterized protein n=1 Tax=Fulvimarina pelagi HTCC2506 TaxID=314231 RepID=Q0FYA4_9HYPH|nr:hypothetical protein FP2506_02580 [Fulvimarina pelagi HTCC2506]